MGSLRDREVACSASYCQGSNFECCVWRAVSSHPLRILLAQFTNMCMKVAQNPFISFIPPPPPPHKKMMKLKAFSCMLHRASVSGRGYLRRLRWPCPRFVSGADLGNPCMDFFNFTRTHPLGGVDVPFVGL